MVLLDLKVLPVDVAKPRCPGGQPYSTNLTMALYST